MPNDVSFVVKTYDRPRCLEKCLRSVRQYAPESPLIVIDDGKTPAKDAFRVDNYTSDYHYYPQELGLSKGRNQGVQMVSTPYTFILDDDHVITDDTKLDQTVGLIREEALDVLCVRQVHPTLDDGWWGVMYFRGTELYGRNGYHWREQNYLRVDAASNSFVADTQVLKDNPWDNNLLLAEHFDFFLRLKKEGVRVGLRKACYVFHDIKEYENDQNYKPARARAREYKRVAMKKHGITKLNLFNGRKKRK